MDDKYQRLIKRLFRSSLTIVLLISNDVSHAQELTRKFSVQELKQDFSIFREILEEAHPGLYWFNSKEHTNYLFDSTYATIDKSMTKEEFFLLIGRFIPKIGCLHTNVIGDGFPDSTLFLPFRFKIINDKTWVYQNMSDEESIPEGSEVLSIDGVPTTKILASLLEYLSNDGYTKGFAKHILGYYYHYYYKSAFRNTERVVLKTEEHGEVKSHIVSAVKRQAWDSVQREKYGQNNEPVIQLTFYDNLSTALLKITRFGHWRINDKKFKFQEVLKEKMMEVINAGVNNLILDIGDRGGGNEIYGAQLLSYLIDEPYVPHKAIEFKTKKFDVSKKYSDTGWFEYNLLKAIMRFEKTDSTYLLRNYPTLKPIKPSKIHFSGNIYMLISNATASATSDFAAWVHTLKLATIIGEETGGGYVGNTSNWEFRITLPNTGVRFWVPLARYFNNVNQEVFFGRGVKPDYEVHPKIEDIINGIDTQLEFTLELIKNRNME